MNHPQTPIYPIVQLAHENHAIKMKYNDLLQDYINLKKELTETLDKTVVRTIDRTIDKTVVDPKKPKTEYENYANTINSLQHKNAELNRNIVSKNRIH
jgi:hypothetical protein